MSKFSELQGHTCARQKDFDENEARTKSATLLFADFKWITFKGCVYKIFLKESSTGYNSEQFASLYLEMQAFFGHGEEK